MTPDQATEQLRQINVHSEQYLYALSRIAFLVNAGIVVLVPSGNQELHPVGELHQLQMLLRYQMEPARNLPRLRPVLKAAHDKIGNLPNIRALNA